jgi:hypothetical protein
MSQPTTTTSPLNRLPCWQFASRKTAVLTLAAMLITGVVAGISAIARAQYVPPEGTTKMIEGGGQDVFGLVTLDIVRPSGVDLRVTLTDGQVINLRARDVVVSFPTGGALRVSESGVLPEIAASPVETATPPALQLDVDVPAASLPTEKSGPSDPR